MSNQARECKCGNMKETGMMLVEYLRSVHECILKGEKILPKDLHDMRDLIVKAEEVFK